jgi:glycine hydroxymethyltransferase
VSSGHLCGLSDIDIRGLKAPFLAFLASLECVAQVAPEVAATIVRELRDQRNNLKLIASENYSSLATQLAMGNLLTDKYAEGVPGARYYAGCDNVDAVESLACKLACDLFGAEHAYVQPHSGADANLVAFWAILRARREIPAVLKQANVEPRDKIDFSLWQRLSPAQWEQVRQELGNERLLALDFSCGGHLTHGYRLNVSARMFQAHSYTVDPTTNLLDYDQIERRALEVRPLILLAGFSAYPRNINYREMRRIADKVEAVLMVDMAHFAGLVAGGVLEGDYNPIPHAHVVTSTTHKTLRGPRGGLVLCTKEYKEHVDKGCPLVLGGPLPHVMAAKAVCFTEALRPEFKHYAHTVVENAQVLAETCRGAGVPVHTGTTENHLVLLDMRPLGLTGYQAEAALRQCGITLNRNALPFDRESPLITSGLRLGSAAVSTLGMSPPEMQEIAAILALVLKNLAPGVSRSGQKSKREFVLAERVQREAQGRVGALLGRFPVYPEIDLPYLEQRMQSWLPAVAAREEGRLES